jgi:flagellar biosynthesis protein FliP
MSTIEEVKAAENAMNQSQDALRSYVERLTVRQDLKLHVRLAAELKTATEKYIAAVLGLNSK